MYQISRSSWICMLLLALGTLVFLNAAPAQPDSTKTATSHSSTQKKSGMNTTNESVVMKTSMGNITIELFADKAPVSVKNFLSYVDEKYYDSTVFHRVIKGFMIQGGGFAMASPIKQKHTKAPIKNESDNGLGNDRGTIAMARTQDPNSATSQFFINVVDNKMLNKSARDAGYAVFGKVTEGMDVVDKIRAVATGNSPAVALNGDEAVQTMFQDVPATPVMVESVRRVHPKK